MYTLKEVLWSLAIDERLFREYIDAGLFPAGIERGERVRVWTAGDVAVMVWLETNRHRLSTKAARKTGDTKK